MIATADDQRWLAVALDEAHEAATAGEVPVGAVVVCGGREVARAQNRMVRDGDATAHAEVLALRAAARTLGTARLMGCTVYITLEPCAMCAGAIVLSRVARVVFSAWDDKAGMAGSVGDLLRHPKLNHQPQVLGGVAPEAARELLQHFFRGTRER
jgi:tRNA(adenine34) deaminase